MAAKFQIGDRVIVSSLKSSVTKRVWLSKPLKNDGATHLNFAKLPHESIINTLPSSTIHHISTPKKNLKANYRVSHPTLEQYITLTSRKAQPIYTYDAQAIVTLADLHLDPPELEWENGNFKAIKSRKQYLEAGTGHGSLSLSIAKALYPANTLCKIFKNNPIYKENDLENGNNVYNRSPNFENDLRGAILHSIDCNAIHSRQGRETVQGFRRGIYADSVEFHLADSPSQFLKSDIAKLWAKGSKLSDDLTDDQINGDSWLDGAFLDMPNYHLHIAEISKNLKVDGIIVAFCPNITQILDGVKVIDELNDQVLSNSGKYILVHEKSIQLLPGIGGGLQEWDTRRTLIRSTGEEGYSVRPKVGVRTVGGGFIAIWRKVVAEKDLDSAITSGSFRDLQSESDANETEKEIDLETETEAEAESESESEGELDVKMDHEIITATELKKENEDCTTLKPKFKSYTFETSLDNADQLKNPANNNSDDMAKFETTTATASQTTETSKTQMSDFMKMFLSEKPAEAESKPEENTIEHNENSLLESHNEYELPLDQSENLRLFPPEALHTIYKNCSGEVHVGYMNKVNMFDAGRVLDPVNVAPIKPTGPAAAADAARKETIRITSPSEKIN
ncbi:hypothetical protein DAMA08_026780 [Martiniozyma asiatica (nom. inval.)]|nr:hypothetical protein DAMA08_026780 [Martiniozyma asiatica]